VSRNAAAFWCDSVDGLYLENLCNVALVNSFNVRCCARADYCNCGERESECVCVCVCERERESERVCVRERQAE